MVEIKEVIWTPIKPTPEGMLGFASLLFGQLRLDSIAVFVMPNGDYRLSFPKKRLYHGADVQVFYPIDKETHEAIKNAIVSKIKEVNSNAVTDGGVTN